VAKTQSEDAWEEAAHGVFGVFDCLQCVSFSEDIFQKSEIFDNEIPKTSRIRVEACGVGYNVTHGKYFATKNSDFCKKINCLVWTVPFSVMWHIADIYYPSGKNSCLNFLLIRWR
jgi:hypothetical protein